MSKIATYQGTVAIEVAGVFLKIGQSIGVGSGDVSVDEATFAELAARGDFHKEASEPQPKKKGKG